MCCLGGSCWVFGVSVGARDGLKGLVAESIRPLLWYCVREQPFLSYIELITVEFRKPNHTVHFFLSTDTSLSMFVYERSNCQEK